MSEPEDILHDTPADFDSSVAYALHAEMRRLIIMFVVGSIVFPVGLAMFFDPGSFSSVLGPEILRAVIGLGTSIVGAALLFGGLIGALFKLVTDANIVAHEITESE